MTEWKTIPGYSSYEATDNAIRSIHRGATLTPGLNNRGYLMVKVTDDQGCAKKCTMHRLIAMAHIVGGPIPPGKVVRHLNDIPTDNRVSNLAVGSPSDNEHDKFRNGMPKPVPPPRAPKECRNFERCGNHVIPGIGTRCEHCRAEFSRGCAVLLADGMDPEEVGRRMEYPALGTIRMAVKYGGLRFCLEPGGMSWGTGDGKSSAAAAVAAQQAHVTVVHERRPSPSVAATLRHILRLGRR